MTSLRFICILGIAFAAYWFGLRGGCGTRGAIACPDKALEEGVGITLSAGEVCTGAGYLCDERRSFQVARWQLDQGKLRVRVGLPEFVDADTGRQIRDAAIEGIKAWDRHPFPIVIDTGKFPTRLWDIGVVWSEGSGAGHANLRGMVDGKRYQFSVDGVSVVVPPLRTAGTPGIAPGAMTQESINIPPGVDPATFVAQLNRMMVGQEMGPAVLAQIQATAMHEMGHALGLFHSKSENDIMFPQFRAGATQVRVSDRDLATVDALYALPNGALVQ